MGALTYFVYEINRSIGIAKLGKTGFHGNSYGVAHFTGIDAVIVIQEVQHGDGIQVINAAIAAMGPDRFIFRLLGKVMAILIMIDS